MPRIMIVEDDDVLSALMKAYLQKLNYEIAGNATSGEQAVEMAKEQNPDLILMDIAMPGKFDGLEAAEIIIDNQNIPIIFLTAFSGKEFIEQAARLTPYGYLVKPVKRDQLKAAIDIALSRREMEMRIFKSEERYRAVVEDQIELVCRYQPDKVLTFVNKAFCRQFERKQSELMGQNIVDFIPVEDLPTNPHNPVVTSERSLELPNGRIKWYQWTDRAIFGRSGELQEYQSVGLDITKRKQFEEELNLHRNHLQKLVEEQTIDLIKAKEDAEMANRAKANFWPICPMKFVRRCIKSLVFPKSERIKQPRPQKKSCSSFSKK